MAHRYYSELPITGDTVSLSGPEAHHLIHVMRAHPGRQVTLFDGSGAEFVCQVRRIARTEVQLQVVERREVDRELPCDLSVACSFPKGDRQRWLVEKCVELGVGRIIPLITKRTVVRPAQSTIDRLKRVVIEASKQCGRNRLLEVALPAEWAELVAASGQVPHRIMAHPATDVPEADHPTGTLRTVLVQGIRPGQAVLAAVGPEGGFTTEEVDLATSAGWQIADLGPRLLRIETAATMLAAVLAAAAARGG